MVTTAQIQTDVNNGKAYAIQQTANNLALMKSGLPPKNFKDITALKRVIRCLQFQINANVIDTDTITLYNCLLKELAGFNSSYTIDPSVIIPGQTVNVIGTGTLFNSGTIIFTDVNPVQILNYNSTLKQLYGNNPFVNIFLTGYEQDEQTPPTFNYLDNDVTKDLLSITWDYPAGIPMSGYIQIGGTVPGATGSGGTNGSLLFTYSQADLVQDIDGAWYLPFTVPVGKRPFYTEVNEVQLTGAEYYRATGRLYGFQNNSTATIIVSVI